MFDNAFQNVKLNKKWIHVSIITHVTLVFFLRYDNLADLYAVINTLQSLEKAYVKDAIHPKE